MTTSFRDSQRRAPAAGEGAVARHHGEVFGPVVIAEKLQGKGDAGVFAIAIVRTVGGMVSVGDATLVDVRAEKFRRALHCKVNFRVFDTKFLRERDQKVAAVSGGVERAVSGIHFVKLTAVEGRVGEGVTP